MKKKIVQIYYDKTGNRDLALSVINNSRTRRTIVDNTLDCLIVHSARLFDLSIVFNPLADAQVVIYADERAMQALQGRYPVDLLKKINENSYGTKFPDYAMAVKTVDSIEEALEHISRYGLCHIEGIISADANNIELFKNSVASDAVTVNVFTL